MQQPLIDTLVWLRTIGDVVFAVGALALVWFIAALWLKPKREASQS